MAVNEELNDNLQRVYRQMLVFSDLAIQREQLTRSAFLAREPLEESREHVSEKDWPGASNDLMPFDREAWILDNGEKPVPDAARAPELKATIRRDVLIGIASGAILYVLLIIFAIGETTAQRVTFAVIFGLVCAVGDGAHDLLMARPRDAKRMSAEIASRNEAAADEAEKAFYAEQQADRSATASLWARVANERIDYENSLVNVRNIRRVREEDEALSNGDGNMLAVIDEQLASTYADYQATDASWYPAALCTLDACRALAACVADGSAATLEEAVDAYRDRLGKDKDLVDQATLMFELGRLDARVADIHDEFALLAGEYARGTMPTLGAHAGVPARTRLVGECLAKGDIALGGVVDQAFWTCYGLWGDAR